MPSPRLRQFTWGVLPLALAIAGGCSSSSSVRTPAVDTGGNAGEGTGGSAGTGANGGLTSAGGSTATACESNARRCEGATPMLCVSGQWSPEPACDDPTPICVAATGVCSGTRITATFVNIEPAVGTNNVKLVEASLNAMQRVCAGDICVTGAILP